MWKVEINMTKEKRFLIATLSIIMGFAFSAEAASRVAVRSTPGANTIRRSVTTTKTTSEPVVETASETTEPEEEPIITNRSSEFDVAVSSVLESASEDNSFAEQIRKQRAALAASDASQSSQNAQKNALATNSNTCDSDLRKCMMKKCGNDFTKCALDGATIFGDKLNACRRDTECTGEEFRLFTAEIQADRDMNVRLASFDGVINCGNQYNACIVNECGTTYNKCLGKKYADAAIQKCATIAKECTESDSGLANRFGTAIGKLRENAEKEVKKDEERMYALRDMMSTNCRKLGAMFDERSFDCVFTVNFFAGKDQSVPMASRKRYAGDTFVCMQEWFGINVTTYKENAYRETRAQTGASSAMLGSGVGTAVGLITSGAIDRSLKTQKAKKDLKKECKSFGGTVKDGKCVNKKTGREINIEEETKEKVENTPTETQGAATDSAAAGTSDSTNAEVKDTKKNKMDAAIDDYKEKGQATLDKAKKSMDDAGIKTYDNKDPMAKTDKAMDDAGLANVKNQAKYQAAAKKDFSFNTDMGYGNSKTSTSSNSTKPASSSANSSSAPSAATSGSSSSGSGNSSSAQRASK